MDHAEKSSFPLVNIVWQAKHALDLALSVSNITLAEAEKQLLKGKRGTGIKNIIHIKLY